MKKLFKIAVLFSILLVLSSCEFNKLKKSTDYEKKLEMAIKYYDKGDFTKAQILFEELQNVYKGTDKAEIVYFYYAYTNFELGDYLLAGFMFRNFVRNFPTSKKAETCAYMTAYCYFLNSPDYALDQADTYTAIKEFQYFLKQYPKSEKIPECNEYIDKLRGKLEKKSYETAIQYYRLSDYKAAMADMALHNREYPGNIHAEELTFLIIKSYYKLGLLSIDVKKAERMKAVVDNYFKFVDTYPKSTYLEEAQTMYDSAVKIGKELDAQKEAHEKALKAAADNEQEKKQTSKSQ
jgi:outer membrane protein assembly factor BamD